MPIAVRQAAIGDLEQVAPLFDAYRQFYGQRSDLSIANKFLLERIRSQQSVLFIATDSKDACIGFTQLFPSFSSVRAGRIFVLNDLFVVLAERNKGVAKLLLTAAAEFAASAGAVRLSLSTALNNLPAQKLYERLGWKRDDVFCHYNLAL